MVFSKPIQEEAFELYIQGLASDEIVRRLRQRHGEEGVVGSRTIRAWAQRGEWRKRRDGIQRQADKLADGKRAEKMAQILANLDDLRMKILDASMSLEFGTAEGAVRSLGTVHKIMDRLTSQADAAPTEELVEQMAEAFFQIFEQDEVLGPQLPARKAVIMARVMAPAGGGGLEWPFRTHFSSGSPYGQEILCVS